MLSLVPSAPPPMINTPLMGIVLHALCVWHMYVVYRDPLFYRAVIGEYFATLGLVVLTLLVRPCTASHRPYTDHTQSIHTQKRPNKHTDAPKTKY